MSSDPEHKAKDLGSVITKLAPYVLSAGLSVGGFYIGAKFDPIYKALEVSESRAIELGKDFRDFVRLREIDRTEAAQARAELKGLAERNWGYIQTIRSELREAERELARVSAEGAVNTSRARK